MFIVYITTNNITKDFYIGSHNMTSTDDSYLGSGVEISKQIQEYGKEHFTRRIVGSFDNSDEALRFEHSLIKELRNSPQCLNRSYGGQNFEWINKNKLNNKVDNYRRGIEKHQELLQQDKEYRKNFSQHIKEGLTPEIKARIKSKLKGRPATFKDRKHTPQTIEKIRRGLKGKQSGEHNSQYGTFWITDGISNMKWHPSKGTMPPGFRKGRVVTKSL